MAIKQARALYAVTGQNKFSHFLAYERGRTGGRERDSSNSPYFLGLITVLILGLGVLNDFNNLFTFP